MTKEAIVARRSINTANEKPLRTGFHFQPESFDVFSLIFRNYFTVDIPFNIEGDATTLLVSSIEPPETIAIDEKFRVVNRFI